MTDLSLPALLELKNKTADRYVQYTLNPAVHPDIIAAAPELLEALIAAITERDALAARVDERPVVKDPPPYMFASEGFYMVNGHNHRVEIPLQPFSNKAAECFGPMWVRADLLPQRTLNKIFAQPVTYWPDAAPSSPVRAEE